MRTETRLFLAALLPRLAWAWLSGQLSSHIDARYDDGAYVDMALSFIGRSPTVWITHPPGYPAFLVPFVALGPAGIALAHAAQAVLGAGLAPLVYRFALDRGVPRGQALAAGLLTACHPMLIFFSARLSTEIPFALLTLGFFWAWLRAWSRGGTRRAAWAGVLGGLSSLTRGVLLPFGGVLALAAWLRRREQPRWASLVCACGLAWAAVVAPWTARNWVRFGRFVPVSQQGGWNLYEGLTLDLQEILWKRATAMGQEVRDLGLRDVFEIDAHFAAKAKAWIREHPGEFLWLTARKALRFWRIAPYAPHPAPVRWAAGFFTSLFFALALIGARDAWRLRGAFFVAAWMAFLTTLHSVFASNLRYRLPLEPFIAVAAGIGVGALKPRLRLDRGGTGAG